MAAAFAQNERRGALWTELPTLSQPIRVQDRVVSFARLARAPRRLSLGQYEMSHLSACGDRCVVYAHDRGVGRVFDLGGDEVARFQTEECFAGLLISNAGLIAAFTPIKLHSPVTQDLRLLDARGNELWRATDRFLRMGMRARFSPDGQLLAVMAPTRNDAGSLCPTAVLFDSRGERWSHAFEPGLRIGDIAFGHQGRRIAFGVYRRGENGNPDNSVFVWDADRPEMLPVACANLGQPITRDCLAFAQGDDRIVVNGLARVQMYDAATGGLLWSRNLDTPGQNANLLDTAVKMMVIRNRIVAAHRINAKQGRVRYAVHVLDPSGKKLGTRLVTEPQPRRADVGRFWDVINGGAGVVIYVEPAPITIAIPQQRPKGNGQ